MDAITQLLQGSVDFALNANFICNLVLFTVVMEGISVIVGHLSTVGRQHMNGVIILLFILCGIMLAYSFQRLSDLQRDLYCLRFRLEELERNVQVIDSAGEIVADNLKGLQISYDNLTQDIVKNLFNSFSFGGDNS